MKKFVSVMLTLAIMATLFGTVFADAIPSINDGPASSHFGTTASVVLGLVRFIGYALAIGMLIYLGIKYVTSSANEKADLKKGSINYVIGAIIIAAATTLFSILVQFGSDAIQDQ